MIALDEATGAPSHPGDVALQLRDVTAGYGTTTILRNVDLAVPAGTVAALLGANGAGKTTLLRTAAGLIRPTTGDVLLAGRTANRKRPFQRAHEGLCLIPEGRGIWPQLSVRDNIALQAPDQPTKTSLEVALDAFPALASRQQDRAGSLSGGQQQMLALCRCFTARPKVVLLDEVSMGLAPLVVEQIFQALRELARTGVALLIVEQYVSTALAMADHVCLLDRGRITFAGAPDDLDEDELVRRYLHADGTEDPSAAQEG